MVRPKVLMLGWEFAPAISGGLGLATYQLAKAISKYADLTVIVPYLPEQAAMPDGFETLAINRMATDETIATNLPGKATAYGAFAEVMLITTELSPYPVPVRRTVMVETDDSPELLAPQETPQLAENEAANDKMSARQIRTLFASGEAYGDNTMEKVLTFTQTVLQLVEGRTFDVIHTHDWLTMQAGVALKHKLGIPLVAHIHSLETDRYGPAACHTENAIYKIEYIGMTEADLVIPVSHYTKNRIAEYYPNIDGSKVHVVYNAINPDEGLLGHAIAPPEIAPEAPKRKMVLFVGRVTYQKGPDFLLETAEKIIAQDPEVIFVVVGTGDLSNWLASEVVNRGIGANFILAGFLSPDRVAALMRTASVYFMPSASEPFGLSALEAGLAGVPTVISAQSGVAEVLDFVLKADYWDTDRFAHYILALLNNPALAQVLSEENRRTIGKMSWDDAAMQVMALYRYLLKKKAD
ncbi:glycosyltransferase [Rhodoflexus caldus]|uniref:glycosyltransferase n=1 Tax=Rhodoflexus caldus TaxID=2891236 RepID=UPI00202A9A1B|nr:glycosyltransferase [Rhodoflexus caldus]